MRRVLSELACSNSQRRARAAFAAGAEKIRRARKPLRRLVRDRDPEVRRAAATALGLVGRPDDAILLHDQLIREARPGVAAALVEALGRLRYRPARPTILRALTRSDAGLRAVALVALGRLGDPTDLWFIERFLRSEDPGLRRSAALSLGALGDPRAVPLLRRALPDPNPAVVAGCLAGLARLGTARDAPAVARLLDHPNLAVRLAAARALQRIGTAAILPRLTQRLGDAHVEVAGAAAVAVARLGGAPPVGLLRRLLGSTHNAARVDALRAAGIAGIRHLIPDILPLVRQGDGRIRLAAIRALGRLSASQAVPLLLRHLASSGPDLRAALLDALAALRALEAIGPALALLRDASPAVRAGAARVLAECARLDPRPLVGRASQIVPLLRPGQPEPVLCAAADAFSEIATRRDRRGFVYLQRLTFHSSSRVRASALRGLGRYGDRLSRPAVTRLLRRDLSPGVRVEAWLAALRLGVRLDRAHWMRGLRACSMSDPFVRLRCLLVRARGRGRGRGRLTGREAARVSRVLAGLPNTPSRAALVGFLRETLGPGALPILRDALAARGYLVRAAARRALSIWPPPVLASPSARNLARPSARAAGARPPLVSKGDPHLFDDPPEDAGSGCSAASGAQVPMTAVAWLLLLLAATVVLRRRSRRAGGGGLWGGVAGFHP